MLNVKMTNYTVLQQNELGFIIILPLEGFRVL